MSDPRFGELLRAARLDSGMSLRDLSERICFHHGYIGKVEQGLKFPDKQFAQLADVALNARGHIKAGWDLESGNRRESERVGKLLSASVDESVRFLDAPAVDAVDELLEDGAALAVEYLSASPTKMLLDAVQLRAQIMGRLKDHNYRRIELVDLYMALARVQGVLTYAALDLGDADAALTHARVAWACGVRAGSNEIMAWVRGTESLALRFKSDYPKALVVALDGLKYPVRGTGRIRVLSGVAQCHANLGDTEGANAILDAADRDRESLSSADEVRGLFEFSRAKQLYYAGSSLMWLPDTESLERAATSADAAIAIWEQEPPDTRSLDDEALAHIYAATARVRLHKLGEARESLLPVLQLPEERLISWIRKRLGGVADLLDELGAVSSEARSLSDEVREVAG